MKNVTKILEHKWSLDSKLWHPVKSLVSTFFIFFIFAIIAYYLFSKSAAHQDEPSAIPHFSSTATELA